MNNEDIKELERLRKKEEKVKEYNKNYYVNWKKRYDEKVRFYNKWHGKVIKGVKLE